MDGPHLCRLPYESVNLQGVAAQWLQVGPNSLVGAVTVSLSHSNVCLVPRSYSDGEIHWSRESQGESSSHLT